MQQGNQMVVIAHREELVDQAAEEIALWNPRASVAVEMATRKADGREDVIVASVQSLQGDRLLKLNPARCEWLVIDECHHATAPSYKSVIDHFLQNPRATLTGFTATPNRADNQAMGQVFDDIVFVYSMLDGINDGWLSDVHGFQIKTGTDISKVGSKDGDFKEKALSNAINTPSRNGAIVRNWLEYCWPRQTMVFTVNVQHAKDLCDAFTRSGVRAAYSWGEDKERHSKMNRYKAQELDVLLNCGLWIEGLNYKQIECIIPAAPTKSQSKLIQEVGRGTRLDYRIDNLVEARRLGLLTEDMKTNCLVMDPVDIFGKHSLVTLPSLFGLSPNLDLQGQSVVAAMKAIEAAQAKYPNADLAGLEHIGDLETFARSANMWAVRFAEDVSGFSELQWTKRGDGSYRILCPKGDFFKVEEDMVGKFSVEGSLKGKGYRQTKLASLSDAVSLVEKTITSDAPEHLILLGREQKWHKQPMSESQRNILKKFRIPDDVIVHMSRGQAAAKITQLFDKRS